MSKKKSEDSMSARGQPRESRGPEEDREKYLDNLRSMNGFTAIADWTGRLHFASEAPLKELGYTEDELLRIPFWEAPWFRQSEESQITVKGTISDALKGKSVECRVETFTKDGTSLPVTFTISPLKGTDGEDIISIVAETEPLGEEPLEASEPTEKPHPSTEKLDSILNVMQEGYFETDEADKLTVANPSAAKLLGYESPGEMKGLRTADLWADPKARGKFLIELSRKGKVERCQVSFRRTDGTEVPVELDAHSLLDATGAMVGSQVLFRDMSTMKELEKRLKESRTQAGKSTAKSEDGASRKAIVPNESENWFTTLTEQTIDGVAIVQNNVVKFANDNLGRILGYSIEELYGSMFTRVVWPRSANTGTRERFATTSDQDMPEPCEIEVTKKDGAPLSVEFSSRAITYEGRPAQFIVLRDTVADKKALDALMESAARWRFVLQNIPDILMTVSQDGGILFTNRELPERDPHGRKGLATSIYDYFPPEHHEQVRHALQRVFREAHVEQFEAAGIRYDHADPWYACRAGPIERQGEIISAVVVCTDISDRREAERLRMSEERLKMLFDYAPDACFLYDPQGILVDGNKAAEEMTGWQKEELAGKHIFESGLLALDDVPWVAEAVGRAGRREKKGPDEISLIRKDGSQVAVEVRSFPINIHGETLILGIARDITERKRAQVAILEAERRYRAIFENPLHMVYVVDDQGVIVEANDWALQRLGFTREDVGKTSLKDLLHPEDFQRAKEGVLEAAVKGHNEHPIEVRVLSRTGEMLWVESAGFLIEKKGEHFKNLAIARDVTERKQAEERMREAERRYRAIFDNPLNLVFINNAQGVFLEANDSAVERMGYTREDLGKKTLMDIVHPDDLPAAMQILAQAVTQGYMEKPIQARAVTKSGEVIWVEAYGYPLQQEGEYRGLAIARDITESKQAEDALRESEEKLAGIVSSVTDSMIIIDEQFNIVWANEVAKSIMGKDMIGKKCHYVYHSRNSPCRPCWVKQTFADSQVHEHETEVVTEKGSHRLFWSKSSVAARHDDGRPRLMLELSRDITERRQAEEALRESERQYRLIADNVTDVIWTLDLSTLQYTYISPSVFRQRGFTVEEAMKRSADETMPMASLKMAMDAMTEEFTNVTEWQKDHSRSRVLEVQQYCKDRSLIWTEIDITGLRDKDGQVTGVLGVTRDVTRRKQAEDALRKSEERYRALVETAPEVIFTMSVQDGKITSLNSAFSTITGWSRGEWVGKHFMELIHPDDVPTAEETLQQAVHGDAPLHAELRFRSKSHDKLVGEVIGTILSEGGNVVEIVGFLRDITQRKESEKALARYADELARSNAELQQFAYVASHDLQEPLRKVKSFTELLAERYQGQLDEKADKYISYVVDGATRMQTLIRDLLTYSRVATRGKPFEPTSFDEVLSQALDNLEMTVKENNAEIDRDPLPTFNADATQMVQLFQNIIGNAIKFHGEAPPHIHVTAESKGNEWLFTISDNGIGFDQQYAERIFVIFQRLHTREEYSGTGIGLAVCKRIVERHGGRIWAESTPGKGSTFRFTIPTRTEKGDTQP